MDSNQILAEVSRKIYDAIRDDMIEQVKRCDTCDASSKASKPAWKTYENLAYISAMERTRCLKLIDKLKATVALLEAQEQYYDAISLIERDNEMLGFDLSI